MSHDVEISEMVATPSESININEHQRTDVCQNCLAQLVQQRTGSANVPGSIPGGATIFSQHHSEGRPHIVADISAADLRVDKVVGGLYKINYIP